MNNETEKQNIPVYFEKINSYKLDDDRFIRCKNRRCTRGVTKNNWIISIDYYIKAIR